MNALKCLLFFCLVLAHGIEATKGKGAKSFIYFDIFWLKSTEECNLGGGFGGGQVASIPIPSYGHSSLGKA